MKIYKAIIIFISILLFLGYNTISVNANSTTDDELEKISKAETVYLEKSFKFPASKTEKYDWGREYVTDYNIYKLDIGKKKLAMVEIQLDNIVDDYYLQSFSILVLRNGELVSVSGIPSAPHRIYIMNNNNTYFLKCYSSVDTNVILHDKTLDSKTIKKSNKGKITKNFEQIYKISTNSKNNQVALNLQYKGEGARLSWYVVGLDKDNNITLSYEIASNSLYNKKYNYWKTLDKKKDYYVYMFIDKYTIDTDYELKFYSGAANKFIEKAKYKKTYKGNTFGGKDYYKFKIKPFTKTKFKIQLKGNNVDAYVTINGKVIHCKKNKTKTITVYSHLNTFSMYVYKKGKYGELNTKGNDYSLKVTKLD